MKVFFTFLSLNFIVLVQIIGQNAPIADQIPTQDTLHGISRQDDYSWMNKQRSIKLQNYLHEENAYAKKHLKQSNLLQNTIAKEILSRIEEEDESFPLSIKNYTYYNRFKKEQNYPKYCRINKAGQEEILLDPNEIQKDFFGIYFGFNGYKISPDEDKVAYPVDTSGNRQQLLFFKDLASGRTYDDYISNVAMYSWGDNQTVYYTTYEEKTLRTNRIYRHIIGTSVTTDRLIYDEKNPIYEVEIRKSTSEQYLFLSTGNQEYAKVGLIDLNDKEAKLVEIPVPEGYLANFDHQYLHQNKLYRVLTDVKTHELTLTVATFENNLITSDWETLYVCNNEHQFSKFREYNDFVLISYKENNSDQLLKLDIKTKKTSPILPPENIENISLGNDSWTPKDSSFLVAASSILYTNLVYEYNFFTEKYRKIYEKKMPNYNPEKFESRKIWVTAKDGAKIPISLIYKKGMQLDGNNPLFLTAYGSYGANFKLSVTPSNLSYLERGFVVAMAHIRGGSELGYNWYLNGKMLNKMNTFTDFIACAEHLVAEKYTNSKKIVIQGGSAGGLLMGAVTNMRPDLFKCVVANVPFVDIINTMLDEELPLTVREFKEWGNPKDKEYFDYMMRYSPYDNVKARNYPAMYVTSGFNDSNVGVWEPAKWVARLRKLKTDNNPLLFYTTMSGGHSGASGRYGWLKEEGMQMAFVLEQLGFKENYRLLKGRVTDSEGEPLPFVNIYINGTTNGTNSNLEGDYELKIRADISQEIVCSSIGYKKEFREIVAGSEMELDFVVKGENLELPSVTVIADSKNFANNVIRKVQHRRKQLLRQVENYSCDIYMKSQDRLLELPKKLPKFMSANIDTNDIGLLWLSESIAKYAQKGKEKMEEITASYSGGLNKGYTWNSANDVLFNFYKNLIEFRFDEIADRGFVSPISSSAFFYYKYDYEGSIMEEGREILKIKIIPKRKVDPVFHGYMYIVKDLWCLHSLDLYLAKPTPIELTDTISFTQQYFPVQDSIWVPASLDISYNYNFLGFRAISAYFSSLSNYDIAPNFENDFFDNTVFKIEEDANKKDSTYWEEERKLVLTQEERNYYYRKDSVDIVHNSPEYLDSMYGSWNKFKPFAYIFEGHTVWNRKENRSYSINSLLQTVSFNTVDGWLLAPKIRITNKTGDHYYSKTKSYHEIGLKYGFSSKKIYGKALGEWMIGQSKNRKIRLEGGYYSEQFYPAIFEELNAVYSLFFKQKNYAKYYENSFLSVGYKQNLFNGCRIEVTGKVENAAPLSNTTDFTIIKNDENVYSDNIQIANNQSLGIRTKIKYTPFQKYAELPWGTSVRASKFPTFELTYEKALAIPGADNDYDYLELAINQSLNYKLLGNAHLNVATGGFLNDESVHFQNQHHFQGNRTFLLADNDILHSREGNRGTRLHFQALPYYTYSTTEFFAQVHYTHYFDGFIINKIPLLRKTKWQCVVASNNLWLEDGFNHHELSVGIENIFKVLRIDFVGAKNDTEGANFYWRAGLIGVF